MSVHPAIVVLGGIVAASLMAKYGLDVPNQPVPPNLAYSTATVKEPIPVDGIRSVHAFNFGSIIGRTIGKAARGPIKP